MTKKRWFRLYIERWRDGTFGLAPNEIAAYITVICELYDNDGLLINPDLDLMARRCGMRPTSFRKALDVLVRRGKLSLDGDAITSKAVSEEIKSREKLDEKSAGSRIKLTEKRNEINEIRRKIPSNTEERIQNTRPREVSAASADRDLPPAVAAFAKRRAMRGRQ
ncbi:MAG: DUF1376 domain-containing protein [Mesorhizobium sp.]|uniref:DUF1376 domain-containing protein n=1 Tax=Mesorhizobium sp. TaxID=1871066 RepID=UPI000FE5AC05|nr:DUF1376 domain-containing protein [Mesorhizobium sp.]RWF41605.1 MAG: DUF1376 domain-containing protein [Mesorhizobium sp.]